MQPRRIHITGGQGSGKTTLAARVAARTGLPVHELDRIARIGGGNGPERPTAERDAQVARIAASDRWITEGVQLGWTEPLLARAEIIVWLDTTSPATASGRLVRRFLSGAFHEMRSRRGRERFLRLRDYARHTRDLAGAVWHQRRPDGRDDLRAVMAAHADILLRCSSNADVEAFLDTLSGPGAASSRAVTGAPSEVGP